MRVSINHLMSRQCTIRITCCCLACLLAFSYDLTAPLALTASTAMVLMSRSPTIPPAFPTVHSHHTPSEPYTYPYTLPTLLIHTPSQTFHSSTHPPKHCTHTHTLSTTHSQHPHGIKSCTGHRKGTFWVVSSNNHFVPEASAGVDAHHGQGGGRGHTRGRTPSLSRLSRSLISTVTD